MPEGPTLIILKEAVQALHLEGKKLLKLDGNSEIDKKPFFNKKVVEFRTWGKHFLICFNDSTIMVHLMLFGSYLINNRKEAKLRLGLHFKSDEINFYTTNVKVYDQSVDELYDWSVDIMADEWKPSLAFKKVKLHPKTLICDILMDQQIFSGCGNIIKNEALYLSGLHPENKIENVPDNKLKELIKKVRLFSFQFLKAKKSDTLGELFKVYGKKICPKTKNELKKEYMGKGRRRTYFCEKCQVLYK